MVRADGDGRAGRRQGRQERGRLRHRQAARRLVRHARPDHRGHVPAAPAPAAPRPTSSLDRPPDPAAAAAALLAAARLRRWRRPPPSWTGRPAARAPVRVSVLLEGDAEGVAERAAAGWPELAGRAATREPTSPPPWWGARPGGRRRRHGAADRVLGRAPGRRCWPLIRAAAAMHGRGPGGQRLGRGRGAARGAARQRAAERGRRVRDRAAGRAARRPGRRRRRRDAGGILPAGAGPACRAARAARGPRRPSTCGARCRRWR